MKQEKNSTHLPDELYISFVESLYANRSVIVFGMIAQALIAYAIAESTGSSTFVILSGLFVLTGFARLFLAYMFDAARPENFDGKSARFWEKQYSVGVNTLALEMGTLTYLAIISGDSFAEFASMTLTMATMVTIVGKNFASSRIVLLFTIFTFVPIATALLQVGGWKHITGAILLVPFGLLVFSMARYVREFLREAVMANILNRSIAEQFDVAVNNMPHGLIMFDAANKAKVINQRAREMIRSSKTTRLEKRDLKTILRFCSRKGLLGKNAVSVIEERLSRMLHGDDERKLQLQGTDGSCLEFSAKKIRGGGGVLLFEDISERVEAEQKIQRMARYDSLTGLPNRTHFREVVRTTLGSLDPNLYSAFFTVDLDDFKHVNDLHGHPVGDELLCKVADRLTLVANERALFSRFGGDEFVGILCGHASPEAAVEAARRAIASLAGQYNVANHLLNLTTSAGIVVTQCGSFEMNGMMIRSDLALYESKSKGKGRSTVFADEMDEKYQRRQRLKSDLKQAIKDHSLKVFYQPIIDARSMRIAGCEALCRWDHPEFGPISPAVFIPIAEETGAISDLTRFMLETATTDCATWPDEVSVAVNLSALDFKATNLVDMVRVALGKSRLQSTRLEVEVTESAILEDQAAANKVLLALKATGVRVSLDDFGTGYSSLSYLHNLPLDKVKIDQSFVREIANDERSIKLVAGVTHLANELGLTVTIEGIETIEQFELLRERAYIDLAQGYLFGAALSARGIFTLIENSGSIKKLAFQVDAKAA